MSRYGKNRNTGEDLNPHHIYQDYIRDKAGPATILIGDDYKQAENLWVTFVCPNCPNRFQNVGGECNFEKCPAIKGKVKW